MTHWLEDVPLDWSKQPVQELWDVLRGSYWKVDRIIVFIQDVGLMPGDFDLGTSASALWREVLREFRLAGKLQQLFDLVKADQSAVGARIDELVKETPLVEAPQPVEGSAGVAPLSGFSETGDERLMVEHDDTLLSIAFLQRGLELAKSVCRFTAVWADAEGHGTGFRIGEDLLLTTYHVLHNRDDSWKLANSAEVWFGYERDWAQQLLQPKVISCDLATVVGEQGHDWAVVRTAAPIPPEFPKLSLESPAQAIEKDDRVNIIQHPEGLPKKVGMVHNLVRAVDTDVLQYWTDTRVGSSGSPVAEESWTWGTVRPPPCRRRPAVSSPTSSTATWPSPTWSPRATTCPPTSRGWRSRCGVCWRCCADWRRIASTTASSIPG